MFPTLRSGGARPKISLFVCLEGQGARASCKGYSRHRDHPPLICIIFRASICLLVCQAPNQTGMSSLRRLHTPVADPSQKNNPKKRSRVDSPAGGTGLTAVGCSRPVRAPKAAKVAAVAVVADVRCGNKRNNPKRKSPRQRRRWIRCRKRRR